MRAVNILLFNDVDVLGFSGSFGVSGTARGQDGLRLFEVHTVAPTSSVIAGNRLSINARHPFEHAPPAEILVTAGGWGTRAVLTEKYEPRPETDAETPAEMIAVAIEGAPVLNRLEPGRKALPRHIAEVRKYIKLLFEKEQAA